MVFIILAAFALGCAIGVFAMVPSWWRHRRVARKLAPVIPATPEVAAGSLTHPAPQHPPRDGL
jgi:hypothetical protein